MVVSPGYQHATGRVQTMSSSDCCDKAEGGHTVYRSLSGKVVLITGASSGIGAATAVEFARQGARLALTGRDVNKLNRVADDCWRHLATSGGNKEQHVLIIAADLSVEDDVRKVVEKTLEKFGRLDVLVNNAGFGEPGNMETTSLDQLDRIMKVNLRAVYQLMMLTRPHLIASKGNVINMSSVSSSCPLPHVSTYSLTKSALDGLTRCNALELGPHGVRVNSVNPGHIFTPAFEKMGSTMQQVADRFENFKKVYPLRRAGVPEDVAKAIAFLASDDASFITGQHLYVDGGISLTVAA